MGKILHLATVLNLQIQTRFRIQRAIIHPFSDFFFFLRLCLLQRGRIHTALFSTQAFCETAAWQHVGCLAASQVQRCSVCTMTILLSLVKNSVLSPFPNIATICLHTHDYVVIAVVCLIPSIKLSNGQSEHLSLNCTLVFPQIPKAPCLFFWNVVMVLETTDAFCFIKEKKYGIIKTFLCIHLSN